MKSLDSFLIILHTVYIEQRRLSNDMGDEKTGFLAGWVFFFRIK